MRAVLVAVILIVILLPVSAHGQELGESDAYTPPSSMPYSGDMITA